MTKTWEAGTPIIDPNGKIVARLAADMEVSGDVFQWAWINAEIEAQPMSGVSPLRYTSGYNKAVLYEDFRRGDFVVLSFYAANQECGMFRSTEWFTEPDAPISETPAGKLAALNVLRDDLQLTLRTVLSDVGAWLDHLQRRYEREAERDRP